MTTKTKTPRQVETAAVKMLKKYFPKGSTASFILNRGPKGQLNKRVYVLATAEGKRIEELSAEVSVVCGYRLNDQGGIYCQDIPNVAANLGFSLYKDREAIKSRILN